MLSGSGPSRALDREARCSASAGSPPARPGPDPPPPRCRGRARARASASIQPTDQVAAAAASKPAKEFVEIGDAAAAHRQGIGRHRHQLQADRGDDAGQADAAERGAEQRRIAVFRNAQHRAIRQQQVEPRHMLADAAGDVVVFCLCMLLASAPPRVTKAVPGETGAMKPRGRNTASRSAKVTPGSATSSPVAASKDRMRSSRPVSTAAPPVLRAASP